MQSELLNKTIEEIENDYWKEEDFPTALVEKCYRIRKKKLRDLEPADLRLLINQDISLSYAVPLALKWLEKDILTESTFYPGDLLQSILRVPSSFWKENQTLWEKYDDLYKRSKDNIMQSEEITEEIKQNIFKEYEVFEKM
jgi:hypothetical protein